MAPSDDDEGEEISLTLQAEIQARNAAAAALNAKPTTTLGPQTGRKSTPAAAATARKGSNSSLSPSKPAKGQPSSSRTSAVPARGAKVVLTVQNDSDSDRDSDNDGPPPLIDDNLSLGATKERNAVPSSTTPAQGNSTSHVARASVQKGVGKIPISNLEEYSEEEDDAGPPPLTGRDFIDFFNCIKYKSKLQIEAISIYLTLHLFLHFPTLIIGG